MADMNFEDIDDSPLGGSLAAVLNWTGAVLSIVLIAGLATWGWKLLVRDVTGVPVVRALEGPMRIAPEDPGGESAEYQGLAVNRIAADGTADDMADRIVLAPLPAALDEDEDKTMASFQPVEVEPTPVLEAEPTNKLTAPEPEMSATDLAVAEALGAALQGELKPQPASFVVELDGNGPLRSPRPIGRPADRRVASLTPVLNDATGEIDPASVPVGTRLVQLGAYSSPEIARAEWAATSARFGDYMVGKDRVVQEASTAGKTFWRLRAMGFDDLADSRRFCSVLVAEGANCIPVVQD